MKKQLLKTICLIPTILVVFSALLPAAQSPATQERWLPGYSRTIRSEKIMYHSPYPGQLPALLVRATDGTMVAEWLTQQIPARFSEPEATFVLLAGMATNKGSHKFFLSVDDRSTLTFTTAPDSSRRQIQVKNSDGLSLSFDTALVDQFDELFGYFFLKVPSRFLTPGKPLRLKLTAEKGGSPDWVMIFEYPLTAWARLKALPALRRTTPATQPLLLEISHPDRPVKVQVNIFSAPNLSRKKSLLLELKTGYNQVFLDLPEVRKPEPVKVSVVAGHKELFSATSLQKPVRPLEFWFIPHSHLDIGYSDYQPVVEKKHWENLEKAIELAEKTSNYPAEARFKWNVEQLWAVETYLRQASPEKKQKFYEAVKKGWVGLQATLANELTGLCHPEELLEWTAFARQLEKEGLPPVKSAMITDIPSYSWSVVPALALAGVQYFSSGPNYMPMLFDGGDRVGWALKAWADRPFYWVSPSGREKILFWMAGRGYSWFHGLHLGNFTPAKKREILEYAAELEAANYPYSLVQVRYTVGGDNGPIDPALPDAVKAWNEEFISPKIVIATTEELFSELEKRHGSVIPAVRGDFSPYWEDGAASTARETAANRNLSHRLLQLETLFALLAPDKFPASDFYEAWRHVVLFHEHTWGAHDSISNPEGENAVKQWAYKKNLLTTAENLTGGLETNLKKLYAREQPAETTALDVFNTSSWERSDLVFIPADISAGRDVVFREDGQRLVSQRLSDGSLAVLVPGLQPFSGLRIWLKPGSPREEGQARAEEYTLENDELKLTVDQKTGAVSSLVWKKAGHAQLVDTRKFPGLNHYLYVPGTDPTKAQPARIKKVEVLDRGPLVASLLLEYEAPGSQSLRTIIRLNSSNNRLEFDNLFDKVKIREKESVHFTFPFDFEPAEVKLDLGWGLANPFYEEIPGACFDFFSIQKSVYLIKPYQSLVWVSPDVPLVEIGEITDERKIEGYSRRWKRELLPSTTLISYALNNYWHTNYVAEQGGLIRLRYYLIPELSMDLATLKKKSLEALEPLLVLPAGTNTRPPAAGLKVESEQVVVTRFKPTFDGHGYLIRFYNVSGRPAELKLSGSWVEGEKVYLSNLKEEKVKPAELPFTLYPWETVTLRIER